VRRDGLVAGTDQVGENVAAVVIEDSRTRRHPQTEIVAALAVLILSSAVLSVLSEEERLKLEIEKGGQTAVGHEDDVAAITAIAARRAAARPVLLAQEGDATGTPMARPHVHLGLVDELHGDSIPSRWSGWVGVSALGRMARDGARHIRRAGAGRMCYCAWTLTRRPLRPTRS
jgi:hypothetical protein